MPGYFEPNDAGIDAALTEFVLPFVRGFAERVAEVAREKAPVDTGRAGAGTLKESIIVIDEGITPTSINFRVSADPIDAQNGFGYGLVAHEGHGDIFPRAGGPGVLRFFWAKKDRFVVALHVNPTAGTPFLTDALIEVNASLSDGFLLEPGDQ